MRRLWGSGWSPSLGGTVWSAAQCAQTQMDVTAVQCELPKWEQPTWELAKWERLKRGRDRRRQADGGSFGGEKGRRCVSVSVSVCARAHARAREL